MANDRIIDLVHSALKVLQDPLPEFKVELEAHAGKGEGYLGKITFITVRGKNKNVHLIAKTSTENNLLRNQIAIKQCFEKEIYLYEEVVPLFRKLYSQPLELLPLCYATKIFESSEALILENLKVKGFDVWDRKQPMTDHHIRLILEGYGKWHALALGLREKQPENYALLVQKNNVTMWPYYLNQVNLDRVMFLWCEEVRSYWKQDKTVPNLKFSEDEIKFIYTKLFLEDPEHHVILHGDCWTNNFMFKTEENSTKPVDLKIIDSQMSGVASPVLDLSMFIYTCVNTEINIDIKPLLEIYHSSLSDCLKEMGCDPKKVFPLKVLLSHWKKYSRYGFVLGTLLLKFSLSDSEEAPDFVETAERGADFMENFKFKIRNEEMYFKRVRDNIIHYVKNFN